MHCTNSGSLQFDFMSHARTIPAIQPRPVRAMLLQWCRDCGSGHGRYACRRGKQRMCTVIFDRFQGDAYAKAPMGERSGHKETFDNSVRPFRSINADGAATRKFIIDQLCRWQYTAFSPSSCFIAIAFDAFRARYENFGGRIFCTLWLWRQGLQSSPTLFQIYT